MKHMGCDITSFKKGEQKRHIKICTKEKGKRIVLITRFDGDEEINC